MKELEAKIVNKSLKYKSFVTNYHDSCYYSSKYNNFYRFNSTVPELQGIVLKKPSSNDDNFNIDLISNIESSYNKEVLLPGGVICDEVGLGKTLSTVSHLITSLEQDKQMKKDGLLKYDINNLIILPSRLISQWIFEINKYVNDIKKINIYKIATLTDIKQLEKKLVANKISLEEIDIVVMCSNLLTNKKYIDLVKQKENFTKILMIYLNTLILKN